MVSISGIDSLGYVLNEEVTLDNSLIVLPLPSIAGGDSNQVSIINLLGKTKRVSLSGLFTGSAAEITTFVTNMNTWANIGFQSARTLTTTHDGSFSVLCDNFRYGKTGDTPNHILYSIELIQGSKLGLLSALLG